MYRSTYRYESICPEEGEPQRHDAEETTPLKCFYSCRYKESFWYEHEAKPYTIDKKIVFFFLDF